LARSPVLGLGLNSNSRIHLKKGPALYFAQGLFYGQFKNRSDT
jgi:hypothetical protein